MRRAQLLVDHEDDEAFDEDDEEVKIIYVRKVELRT